MGHHHHRADAHGHHHGRGAHRSRLAIVLVLALVSTVAEIIGSWLADSLALWADAGHMFSDAAALGLSLFAAWIAERPPTPEHSYGYRRAEILAALANGTTLIAISIVIFCPGRPAILRPTPGRRGLDDGDRLRQPDRQSAGNGAVARRQIGKSQRARRLAAHDDRRRRNPGRDRGRGIDLGLRLGMGRSGRLDSDWTLGDLFVLGADQRGRRAF